jgi:phosphoribosylaminoimidazole carboxylase (NCAIR synthetase)
MRVCKRIFYFCAQEQQVADRVDAQLTAEAEGMDATALLTASREGQLASEAQHVQTALNKATQKAAT